MTRLGPDWPAAVRVLNERGASDLVLLCEHASNHIPAEYEGLGLDAPDLERHIAWDIGAAALAQALSRTLDAPLFLAGYSRLLVDLNRPLHVAASNIARSEDTDIPGNRDLPPSEAERRARLIFHPFHDRVAAHMDRRLAAKRPTRLLCVHSFTPVFHGGERPWHAGVLFDPQHSRGFGERLLAGLAEDPALTVGANVPYEVSRDDDYSLYVHGADRGLPAALLEVRQDLLSTPRAIAAWNARIAGAIGANAP
ncbi:MAG: N-formylglutamate amidohydrolase [Proteobacteria bacterium]|nr:N-formylglutamate amidohydrolase [Pseudomonadota bacterium]